MKKRMKERTKKTLLLSVAALALVAVTAGASIYVTKEMDEPAAVQTIQKRTIRKEAINWDHASIAPRQMPQSTPQQVASACNDNNIVGTAVGGVAGGVLGSNVGKGHGKTAATIGGTLGGAYLGNQLIPTRNLMCR